MSLNKTKWHIRADADWVCLAPDDPEAVLTVDPVDQFHAKQGRSIARWRLGKELAVYLKRHYQESRLRGWLAMLTGNPRWSAAWQEYRRLRWVASRGFYVPRAVAVGVGVGPGTQLRGYLAVEELYGMKALNELIPQAAATLPPDRFMDWKRGLITELARVSKALHSRRCFHKDLYLCHFFVPERFIHHPPDNWTNQVAMIDLHRFSRHTFTALWWKLKDLAQLLYSSGIEGVTARDRLRFWKLYAGNRRHRGTGPLVRRLILVRWNNYKEHNAARKAA